MEIIPGADRTDRWLDLLTGSNVAVVANPTSRVGDQHLVDFLLGSGVRVVRVFAPEHGFRGDADAGESVAGDIDPQTGIPIVSLYGDHKKPEQMDFDGVDLLVYDIQDVGVRFYTYISTLHNVMAACAEHNMPTLVLDRPNPHGGYVDGPVLEPDQKSFVGMHPIPVIYDLTPAELAQMINGEGWLGDGLECKLKVIRCFGYKRAKPVTLSVPPSPNLRTPQAVELYPSLCLFEGTPVSVGRGTDAPFEAYGHPDLPGKCEFTPQPAFGAKEPLLQGQNCRGVDLSHFAFSERKLHLQWIINAYQAFPDKTAFFTDFFDKLAGTHRLREQIQAGKSEDEIRESWQPAIHRYLDQREPYLLYE